MRKTTILIAIATILSVTIINNIPAFAQNVQFLFKFGSYGSGDGQFNGPHGIAFDSLGNVYVADILNHRIQKFTSDGKFITKWGSFGSEIGQLNWPPDVAVDSSDNVYVADQFNQRIQKFTNDGKFITKWGSRGSGDGQFHDPGGIAVDSLDNVYVGDSYNCRIQVFTSEGKFITKWGSCGRGDGQFSRPQGMAFDSLGNVYVADNHNRRVQKFTSDGKFITKWGSGGLGDGQFSGLAYLSVDSFDNVYVADFGNAALFTGFRVQMFTSDGTFRLKWGTAGSGDGQFLHPRGIAIDGLDRIYVSDGGTVTHRVQVFSIEGLVSMPGDLNGDSKIDLADYNEFRYTLGKCVGDSGYNSKADFDEDSCVSYRDYRIWYGYYLDYSE